MFHPRKSALISGNTASSGWGGGAAVLGGWVYGNDDAANANEATVVNGGHALYKHSGTVTINGTSFNGTAQDDNF
jgi:hypothetical protein